MLVSTSRIVWRFPKLASGTFVSLMVGSTAFGQQLPAASKSPREPHEMMEDQTRSYVRAILSDGFPESHSDEVLLLAMNRGLVVIPELVAAIKNLLKQAPSDETIVYRMADAIAYAADENAVDVLTQLCLVDEKRFGYFLKRSLTYAAGRRNSFALAYTAISKLGPRNQLVIEWAQNALSFESSQQQFAAALFERYHGTPTELNLISDPIATQLKGGIPSGVRANLQALEALPAQRR